MVEQHTLKTPESIVASTVTRRRFLQGSSLTAAGVLGLFQSPPLKVPQRWLQGGLRRRLEGDSPMS